MTCARCRHRHVCEGDECRYKYDPFPEETDEAFRGREEEREEEENEKEGNKDGN